jgi:hypothetical protein
MKPLFSSIYIENTNDKNFIYDKHDVIYRDHVAECVSTYGDISRKKIQNIFQNEDGTSYLDQRCINRYDMINRFEKRVIAHKELKLLSMVMFGYI